MKSFALEDMSMTVAELVDLAQLGPFILTRDGVPVVVVEDVRGEDEESISLSRNPKFMAIIEESRRSYREHGGISAEDLRRELVLEAGANAVSGSEAGS